MIDQILLIAEYIAESFIHTWPYLLITIPIAVAVKMSGASKYIERAFSARPIIAIFLATFIGAFSPLCSCSVIPVVAALLLGGVPLGPVMSFWIASPSMDPEIFLLTVSSLGWELAIWRLSATLILSLGSGFITHLLVNRNLLGVKILREAQSTKIRTTGEILKQFWFFIQDKVRDFFSTRKVASMAVSGGVITLPQSGSVIIDDSNCGCDTDDKQQSSGPDPSLLKELHEDNPSSFWYRLGQETWKATAMVVKFMLLAWFLGALIRLYIPDTWITSSLGGDKSWAIIAAAFIGIPVYTSNLAAMPLVGGLLAQGMHPAAALAFLIAGPTTTLPAMSAVWGLVNRKVFALYIGFSLVGAIVMGYLYSITL